MFATRRFAPGEVVCRNPVLLLDREDWRRCEPTILDDYVYAWPGEGRPRAVSLGVGSLFNASEVRNVDVQIDVAAKTLTFRVIRPVEPGQELVLGYGWGPARRTGSWGQEPDAARCCLTGGRSAAPGPPQPCCPKAGAPCRRLPVTLWGRKRGHSR